MSDNKSNNTNKTTNNKPAEETPAVTNTPATPVTKESVMDQLTKATVNPPKEVKKEEGITAKYLENVPASAYPVIDNLATIVDEIKRTGTIAQKSLVSSLEKYIEKMSPGIQVKPEDGAIRQYALWRAIKRILEDDPANEFKGLWTILLAYVRENVKGCFAHTHRYRFTEYWTKSQAELDGLNNILNLLVIASNPEIRTRIGKEVKLSYTLLNGFKDEARRRVFSYYGNV